jgi:ribose transport system ATP-binding protein
VQILRDLILKMQARGMAILYISHRLKEVFDFSETITVLKDGRMVGTVGTQETTMDEVIRMMVGRQLDRYFPDLAIAGDIGDVVLNIENGANNAVKDINLKLRAGEIVGFSGLEGSGRTALAQAIFGVEPFDSGKVEIFGQVQKIKSPAQAISHRMGFVTEDRKAEGIMPNQPLRDNILISVRSMQSVIRRIVPNGVSGQPDLVPKLAKQVDIRAPSYGQEVQYLSGGNQQKVVLAKWLAATADIFIFDEPTRGIDVEAKASIHIMLRDLARQGAAVLMISSELPEVIGMSDRIIVMLDGTIAG